MRLSSDRLASGGLVAGAVFTLVGILIPIPIPRAILWMIGASAIVMATALLALKFSRVRRDLVAGGFLVFCIGQGIILSTVGSLVLPSATVFASGAACWAVGLTLISAGSEFPPWVRLAGLISAALFAITSFAIQAGVGLTAVSIPLPAVAYVVLALTAVGWAISLSKMHDEPGS